MQRHCMHESNARDSCSAAGLPAYARRHAPVARQAAWAFQPARLFRPDVVVVIGGDTGWVGRRGEPGAGGFKGTILSARRGVRRSRPCRRSRSCGPRHASRAGRPRALAARERSPPWP